MVMARDFSAGWLLISPHVKVGVGNHDSATAAEERTATCTLLTGTAVILPTRGSWPDKILTFEERRDEYVKHGLVIMKQSWVKHGYGNIRHGSR